MGLINEIAAATILRLILGILFLNQGYDKVFRMGVPQVIETFSYPMKERNMPLWVVSIATYITSYIELLGGLLLIAGLFRSFTLCILGFDLLIVSFAFSLLKPVWDMEHVFPRLVILGALLMMPSSWDILTLDQLFRILTTAP